MIAGLIASVLGSAFGVGKSDTRAQQPTQPSAASTPFDATASMSSLPAMMRPNMYNPAPLQGYGYKPTTVVAQPVIPNSAGTPTPTEATTPDGVHNPNLPIPGNPWAWAQQVAENDKELARRKQVDSLFAVNRAVASQNPFYGIGSKIGQSLFNAGGSGWKS